MGLIDICIYYMSNYMLDELLDETDNYLLIRKINDQMIENDECEDDYYDSHDLEPNVKNNYKIYGRVNKKLYTKK